MRVHCQTMGAWTMESKERVNHLGKKLFKLRVNRFRHLPVQKLLQPIKRAAMLQILGSKATFNSSLFTFKIKI